VQRTVTVDFKRGDSTAHFNGPVDTVTFGREQYQWTGRGPDDLPNPDRGLQHSRIQSGARQYIVAPESLTVLRGTIATTQ
jgi:hypothetical protein